MKTDIVFRVQFNVGFPRQVMNFPIELRSYISGSGRSAEIKEIFEKDTILRSRANVVVWYSSLRKEERWPTGEDECLS